MVIISCSRKSTYLSATTRLPDSYYTANGFMSIGFLKVDGVTAIADLFCYQTYPRSIYSDTLAYDANDNSWKGKVSRVYTRRKFWYISCHEPLYGVDARLKSNELRYKEKLDSFKNVVVCNLHLSEYRKKNSENLLEAMQRYNNEEKKHEIRNKTGEFKHPDFLLEFDKFKTKLED